MRKVTLMISAAALALTGGGLAVAAQKDGAKGPTTLVEAQERAGTKFERMDANSDGVLNAEDKAAKAAERFAAADADNNGEVTQAEMQAAREARKAERQAKRAERGATGDGERAMRRGAGDGERSERREARMAERFASLDTDNSGGLSAAEMTAAQEARGQRGQRGERAEGERRGGRDGKRAGKRGKRGGKGGGKAMMQMADTNGDQSVSRAEFDAAVEARFAAADTNGDGTITTEERKAARDAKRAERMEKRAERKAETGQPAQ